MIINTIRRQCLKISKPIISSIGTTTRRSLFSTKIADSILDLIGNTPMVRLNKIPDKHTKAEIILKLESMEPCSSVKDRIGWSMIHEAEKRGDIVPGKTTLIEPTSGNTGIALAMVAAARGFDITLTMPESMSMERRVMLLSFGAKVVLTPAPKGMKGAIAMAESLLEELGPSGYMLRQFSNPDNPKIHYETTGPEIWDQTDGNIDVYIAGVGTGGTLTGTSKYLKEKNPNLYVVGIEPVESAVMSGGEPAPHKIQGIGAGFIPGNMDMEMADEIFKVSGEDAMLMSRRACREEGLSVGISSGAAIQAAMDIASRPEFEGKRIVTIIPSFGERYLSTALYQEYYDEAAMLPTDEITDEMMKLV